LFSNHTRGQDILHIGVYDKDLIFDDKIGSTEIDLHELYDKSSSFFVFCSKCKLFDVNRTY